VRTFVANHSPDPSFPDPWRAVEDLKKPRSYAPGDFLFREGELCLGVYLVKKGQVRVMARVRAREYRTFEMMGPGGCLGLNEVMGGMAHKFTAEAVGTVEVDYIERMSLMKFLHKRHDVCMRLVCLLSDDLHGLYQRIRAIGSLEGKGKKKMLSHRVH
jgi:CRP/FNR family transcriptional regulator, dissimilatory nitrate respiration regulator